MPDKAVRLIQAVLGNHPEIGVAFLFGSLATGRAGAASDADLAVAADGPLPADQRIRLIDDLAGALGRPVDLIDLATAGGTILRQALAGTRVLVRDPRCYAELIKRQVFGDADWMPLYRRLLRSRVEAMANG